MRGSGGHGFRSAWWMQALSVAVVGCFVGGAGMAGFGCASGPAPFRTTVQFEASHLSRVSSRGKSLLVMPVLTAQGPDRRSIFSFDSVAAHLDAKRGRFTLENGWNLADKPQQRRGGVSFPEVCDWFYRGEEDAAAKSTTIWRAVSEDYVLVIKLRAGARINTFDREEKLRLLLDAELWDTGTREVVWRANTAGVEDGERVGEESFVRRGLAELLGMVPVFHGPRPGAAW